MVESLHFINKHYKFGSIVGIPAILRESIFMIRNLVFDMSTNLKA